MTRVGSQRHRKKKTPYTAPILHRRPKFLWTPVPVNLVQNTDIRPADRTWPYKVMSTCRESFPTHLACAAQSELITGFLVIW